MIDPQLQASQLRASALHDVLLCFLLGQANQWVRKTFAGRPCSVKLKKILAHSESGLARSGIAGLRKYT